MDTAFVRVKRCFALRLKNKVYIQVIRAWNELFRFMALRTRHISFILHLSEVKFTTRLVIPMDIDGLRWVPMDPIGFHSLYYGWDGINISCLQNICVQNTIIIVWNKIVSIVSKNEPAIVLLTGESTRCC